MTGIIKFPTEVYQIIRRVFAEIMIIALPVAGTAGLRSKLAAVNNAPKVFCSLLQTSKYSFASPVLVGS